MEIRRHDEDEVYEASRTGSVENFKRLIEKDPHILRRMSLQTSKTETPLHVSALLGHAEFTKALCINNPKLAEQVDADGRTPLHLASAEGHKDAVEALLSVYAGACSRVDENGRIPLHYAAMRGEVEVLQKLIDKNPESTYVKVENRSKETVLHLCIKHNRLECLKLLVERDNSNGEFLNSRAGCDGGVTILHLALMLRQIKKESHPSASQEVAEGLAASPLPVINSASSAVTNSESEDNPSSLRPNPDIPVGWPADGKHSLEWIKNLVFVFYWASRNPDPTQLPVFPVVVVESLVVCPSKILHKEAKRRSTIRYLLSVDAIKAEAIGVNGMSLTMLDVIEYSSIARGEFSRSLEIQQILIDAGLIKRENNENDKPNTHVAVAAVVSPNPRRVKKKKKLHKRVASSEKGSTPARRCWIKLMEWLRYPSNWVVETRGMLMVVATMISTMTFQAVVNPPGGVWDHNDTNTAFGNITVCNETSVCKAGAAVLSYGTDDPYNYFPGFITCNTISFLASLSVTLLLVSGFPLHNRFCTWLLSMSMCVTLTFLALTYLTVLKLIVPPDHAVDTPIYEIFFYIWIALLVIAGVMHTIRFLIWVTKFRSKLCLKNMISTGSFSCNDATRFEEIDSPAVV
ncbi:unnamed protein product [Malus baccata var. baccata]